MPDVIERPLFHEGQCLSAGDLTLGMGYLRDQNARHQRTAHSWGILDGLTLALEGNAVLIVKPGMAVDSSGASIIVPKEKRFSLTDFGKTIDGVYPIFLVATQKASQGSSLKSGASANPTRLIEEFKIVCGELNDANRWDDQGSVPVSQGPDDAAESRRRILLGFVKYNKSPERFDSVSTKGQSARPRYAGVRGNELVSPLGHVTVRAAPPGKEDSPLIMLNPEDEKDTAALIGLDDGKGGCKSPPLARFLKNGNLAITGVLQSPTLLPGAVAVESGLATHGAFLPLPRGITSNMVKTGQVILHTILTPRPDLSARPPAVTNHVFYPLIKECVVNEFNQISCLVNWIDIDAVGGANSFSGINYPGGCHYLIVASSSST